MTMWTNIFRAEWTPMGASVSREGYAFNRYFSDGRGEPAHGHQILLLKNHSAFK
jgi:hypothetical protein